MNARQMTETVIVVTVGGSCQPVITAINDYQPEFVCFLVSTGTRGSRITVDGSGSPCQVYSATGTENKPSIVTQTGLATERYTIAEIEDPDSLQDCYAKARAALNQLILQFPGRNYVADYTGGTKTMSVGLALAALEADWKLSLVKGARTDLVKVADGTEVAGLVNSWEVRARQYMEEARRLFNEFNYSGAEKLLEFTLRSQPVSTTLQTVIRQWIAYARGFDAWDRFDHERAFQVLNPYQGKKLATNLIYLKKLTGRIGNNNGYEPVFDLFKNAERRAAQGRYDDAVARLYRACELFAQVRLRQRTPPLESSNLDVTQLPAVLHPQYNMLRDRGDGRIRLGLRQDFELLNELEDPVGAVYQSRAKVLLNALSARNHSILAHGSTPLRADVYKEVAGVFMDLVYAASQALKVSTDAPQFPLLMGEGLVQR